MLCRVETETVKPSHRYDTNSPDDFFDIGSHDVVHHQLLLGSDARVRATVSQNPPFPEIVGRFNVLNVRLLDSVVLEGSVERNRGLPRRYRVPVDGYRKKKYEV